MDARRSLALVAALTVAACSSGDPTPAITKAIIDDISAQRFAQATARYRAEETLVLSSAAAPAWRRGLEHQDSTVREWSVDSLARIGDPEDVARVVAALDDPFRRVQEAAARSIILMAPDAAVEAFTVRLQGDDALRQMIAAQGLADLGDPAGVAPLIEIVADPSVDAGVRGVASQSLALLEDPSAVAALATLASDPDADLALRRTAAEALSTFENEEATAALSRLTSSDDDYIAELANRVIVARR